MFFSGFSDILGIRCCQNSLSCTHFCNVRLVAVQCERTAPVSVSDFIFKDFTTIFIQSLFLKFSFFSVFI